MSKDDSFDDLINRSKRNIGWNDPLPEPPKPLGDRPQPPAPSRLPPQQSSSSPPPQPPQQTPPDDSFWRKAASVPSGGQQPQRPAGPIVTGDEEIDELIARIAGQIGPTAEYIQQRRDEGYDTNPQLSTRFWIFGALDELETIAETHHSRARLVLEALAGVMKGEDESLQRRKRQTLKDILIEAANPAPHWASSAVPSDLWGRIKRGEVSSNLVNYLAESVLETTEAPGIKWHMLVTHMEFIVFDEERRRFVSEWYSQRTWPVWNFRNWEDLRAFEGRVAQALVTGLDEEWIEKGYRLLYLYNNTWQIRQIRETEKEDKPAAKGPEDGVESGRRPDGRSVHPL